MPLPPDPPSRRFAATEAKPTAVLQTAVLVVAILYVAHEVFVPIALAVLLGFVLAPVVAALRRVGLPRIGAVLLAVAVACVAIGVVGALLGGQLVELAGNLTAYQAALSLKLSGLGEIGEMFRRAEALLGTIAPQTPTANEAPPPMAVAVQPTGTSALESLGRIAGVVLQPVATAGIVAILAVFVLLYREDLRDRLISIFGAQDPHRTMAAMDDAASRLSRFFLAQVTLNGAYGAAMTAVLWAIGVPSPLLSGALAGAMRFVPFVGTPIAVALPALLAMAADPGWGMLIWVLAIYAVGEATMGQVMEPLIFGHSTGVSPMAVMLAAVFWTWLWGPIGLVLAVPLTACLVVLGRHVEALGFLEIALGNRPPLAPEETFYQRALAGDAQALGDQADRLLRDMSLVAYFEAVAMPALRFAQDDVRRGVLAAEKTERLRGTVATLLDELDEPVETPPLQDAALASEGAVLLVPGRGRFDTTAAALLGRVLAARGIGVQVGAEPATGTAPLQICLCLIEGGGSVVGARTVFRRLRRAHPGVTIAVFAAAGGAGRPVAETLGREAPAPPVAATLAEAAVLLVPPQAAPLPAAA